MIKKFIYGFAIIAGLAACNDDYNDWTAPQANPQEPADGIEMPVLQPAAVVYANLDENNLDNELIQLYTPDAQFSKYEVAFFNGDKSVMTTPDANGCITAAELQDIVRQLYGRAPYERDLKVEVYAEYTKGESTYKAIGKTDIKVTLVAPYISNNYWIVGAPSEWDPMNTSLAFTRGSDADLYDDPVFTVTFPVSAGDTWFAIADEKTHEIADWSGLLGCAEGNGNNGMSGSIARRPEIGNDGSWKVSADADCYVRMTIDMMEYTYKIELLLFQPYLYLPGDANGWSFDKDILLGNGEGLYEGYAVVGGEWGWKASQFPDWNHGDYGNGGEGKLEAGKGNIMEGSEAKQYFVTVDLAAMTYDLMEVTSFSIIGSVKGNWDTDVDLTPNLAERCWTVTTDLSAGEFKFRVNHDWGKNLGGTYESMEQNGANLQLPEDGNYTITLYPSYNGASRCTVVKN